MFDACYNGSFHENDYIAGQYIFNDGQTLVAQGNTRNVLQDRWTIEMIGLLRGDDGAVYFQMLTHDFKQAELQRLKAKAAKIPPKIRVFSFAMLLCFLATYFAIIGYEIVKSMGTLF